MLDLSNLAANELKERVRKFVDLVEQRKRREALAYYRKQPEEVQKAVERYEHGVWLREASMQF